jgi:isochorismate synthase
LHKPESIKVTTDELLQTCLDKNLNFAAYRLPNSHKKELIVQKSSALKILAEGEFQPNLKGFLVAPFTYENETKAFIINADVYINGEANIEDKKQIQSFESIPFISDESHVPEEIKKEDYLNHIKLITDKIYSGSFEKVVLSRVKIVPGKFRSKLADVFNKLCQKYENAFVYIFNAGSHLWIGATPEPLLKANNGTMHTVSLAGTRSFSEDNLNIGAWNSKERLEQEYVTRYITNVLSKFNLLNVKLDGPYTKRAGNLLHLRTDFSFRSEELKDKLGQFLSELHPTPAVCGMPRKDSLQLIRTLEKHNREYYAGFLGQVGLNDKHTLFVNLRCMKILANRLALFVGGGITSDSKPEEEWQETEIKAETLLSVIRQIEN